MTSFQAMTLQDEPQEPAEDRLLRVSEVRRQLGISRATTCDQSRAAAKTRSRRRKEVGGKGDDARTGPRILFT
jgi:hypothetical protein